MPRVSKEYVTALLRWDDFGRSEVYEVQKGDSVRAWHTVQYHGIVLSIDRMYNTAQVLWAEDT